MDEPDPGHVHRIHDEIKSMAIAFELRPGERINESALARRLSASRTPVREVLNRLVGEGLVRAIAGKGFFGRDLDAGEIRQLYEARAAIERETARLAALRRTDDEAQALASSISDHPDVDGDETFHENIARMARNPALAAMLDDIRAQIRCVRATDLASDARSCAAGHRAIAEAIAEGKAWKAMLAMDEHIGQSHDRVDSLVAETLHRLADHADEPAIT